MLHMQKIHNRLFRYVGLLTIAAFGILSTLGSGGGGDDGGGGTTDTVGLLPLYNYEIQGVSDDGTSDGLTVDFDKNSESYTLRANPDLLTGTFRCDTVTEICELASISIGSFVWMVDTSTTPLFGGDFNINVSQDITFPAGGGNPTSGSYSVIETDSLFLSNVTVNPGGPDCFDDVLIEWVYDTPPLPTVGTACYTWAQFEAIDDTSPEGEQVAQFAKEIFEFFIGQSEVELMTLDLTEQIISNMNNPGVPLDVQCDAFSDFGLNVPTRVPAVPDFGWLYFTWNDDEPGGVLGNGDSFKIEFNDCWFNEPPDSGILLSGTTPPDPPFGTIDMLNFTALVDGNNDLTRFGFEDNPGTALQTEGVYYTDFVLADTSVTTFPDTQIDSTMTINGGVTVVFYWP